MGWCTSPDEPSSHAFRRFAYLLDGLAAEGRISRYVQAGDSCGLLMAKSAIDGVVPLYSVRARERLVPLAAALESRQGRNHRELAWTARQVATPHPAWFRARRAGRWRPGGPLPPVRRDGVTRCRARARRGDPASAGPYDR